MTDKYKDALHQAQEELAKLEERRTVLLRLIQNLKDLSSNEMYEMTPPPGYIPKGLTEEIKTILALTTVHLEAMQIRDSLVVRGIKYSSSKNLLINVHTVLGRIKDELDVIERDGKSAYRSKGMSGPEYFDAWVKAEESKGLGPVQPPPLVTAKTKK